MPYSEYRPGSDGHGPARAHRQLRGRLAAKLHADLYRGPLRHRRHRLDQDRLPVCDRFRSGAVHRSEGRRATPPSKPRTAPRSRPGGSSSATSGPGTARSTSTWSRTSSRRATPSRSASATGASARRASACRPIARASSSSTSWSMRSRPTIMSRCRKVPRSGSCRAGRALARLSSDLRARQSEPFRLALKIDDKWGNPSDRVERVGPSRRRWR